VVHPQGSEEQNKMARTVPACKAGEPAKDWMVLSDRPPRKLSVLREFQESDRLNILELPQDHRFQELAHKIELAMKDGARVSIRVASTEFLGAAADFYKIRRAYVHALAAQYPEHFKIMWYQGCGPKVR